MKKILSLLLVLVMVFAFAGCNNTNAPTEPTTEPTEPEVALPESALVILETVWNSYEDDNKFFAIGGSFDAPVDNAPGAYNLTDEGLTATLLVPADQVANLTEAASLMHAMNANTFTCGAYALAEGTDVAAFTSAMRDAIQGNQWMCGFPERLIIVTLGDKYVVTAYGHGDAINPFKGYLTAAYADAVIAYEEAVG